MFYLRPNRLVSDKFLNDKFHQICLLNFPSVNTNNFNKTMRPITKVWGLCREIVLGLPLFRSVLQKNQTDEMKCVIFEGEKFNFIGLCSVSTS